MPCLAHEQARQLALVRDLLMPESYAQLDEAAARASIAATHVQPHVRPPPVYARRKLVSAATLAQREEDRQLLLMRDLLMPESRAKVVPLKLAQLVTKQDKKLARQHKAGLKKVHKELRTKAKTLAKTVAKAARDARAHRAAQRKLANPWPAKCFATAADVAAMDKELLRQKRVQLKRLARQAQKLVQQQVQQRKRLVRQEKLAQKLVQKLVQKQQEKEARQRAMSFASPADMAAMTKECARLQQVKQKQEAKLRAKEEKQQQQQQKRAARHMAKEAKQRAADQKRASAGKATAEDMAAMTKECARLQQVQQQREAKRRAAEQKQRAKALKQQARAEAKAQRQLEKEKGPVHVHIPLRTIEQVMADHVPRKRRASVVSSTAHGGIVHIPLRSLAEVLADNPRKRRAETTSSTNHGPIVHIPMRSIEEVMADMPARRNAKAKHVHKAKPMAVAMPPGVLTGEMTILSTTDTASPKTNAKNKAEAKAKNKAKKKGKGKSLFSAGGGSGDGDSGGMDMASAFMSGFTRDASGFVTANVNVPFMSMPELVPEPAPRDHSTTNGSELWDVSKIITGKDSLPNGLIQTWRQVPNYPNYSVSDMGRVRNDTRRDGKHMKQRVCRNGYKHVTLSDCGFTRGFLVHRLVAQTFLPNDDHSLRRTVDHMDRDRTNNHLSNLRWATDEEQRENRVMPGPDEMLRRAGTRLRRLATSTHPEKAFPSLTLAAEWATDYGDAEYTWEDMSNACKTQGATVEGFVWLFVYEPDKPGEEWKPIPILPGYDASNKGRIRRGLPWIRVFRQSNAPGHYQIRIDDSTYSIHRLVAAAWKSTSIEGKHVIHLDGEMDNHKSHNLRVLDPSDAHAFHRQRREDRKDATDTS
jgi:hypothetical protein